MDLPGAPLDIAHPTQTPAGPGCFGFPGDDRAGGGEKEKEKKKKKERIKEKGYNKRYKIGVLMWSKMVYILSMGGEWKMGISF
ncbi:hypothetical protein LC724_27235 [Blautia sp. RD014234]|nr:hypothetical protein [Blautia parvula]